MNTTPLIEFKKKIEIKDLSLKEKLTQNDLYFSAGWSNEMNEISQCIKEWRIHSLNVHFQKKTALFRKIDDIFFPNLQRLEIFLYLETIENFCRIHIPQLIEIRLQRNHLCTFSILRKCNWNLTGLTLYENYLPEAFPLTQLPFGNRINEIALELSYDPVQSQNVSWAAKLNCQTLSTLWLKSTKRIHQQHFYEALKRKYNHQILIQKLL